MCERNLSIWKNVSSLNSCPRAPRHPSRMGGHRFKAGELVARSPLENKCTKRKRNLPGLWDDHGRTSKILSILQALVPVASSRQANRLTSGLWPCLGSRATSTKLHPVSNTIARNRIWGFGTESSVQHLESSCRQTLVFYLPSQWLGFS